MINSNVLILYLFLLISGIAGCVEKKIVKRKVLLDVTKYNKINFQGMRGEKVSIKFNGTFSGNIKFAMISSANKLTAKNFTVFKNSMNLDIGTVKIYQDDTGFIWYIRPKNVTAGKIEMIMTEYRN